MVRNIPTGGLAKCRDAGHEARLAVVDWLWQWWGGVELWLVQLPVAVQFPVVMIVVLPLCLGVARLIDRVADWGAKNPASRVDDAAPEPEPEPEKVAA
jgi:hypothetical protein